MGARTREGRGWPTTSTTTTEKRPHDKDRSESNVLSATSADTHLESYMVAEPVRESGDLRGVEHVVNRIEVETPRKIAQRNGTNHPGEDHPGEDQPGDRAYQDFAESVHRQSCCCDCCDTETAHSESNDAQNETR